MNVNQRGGGADSELRMKFRQLRYEERVASERRMFEKGLCFLNFLKTGVLSTFKT